MGKGKKSIGQQKKGVFVAPGMGEFKLILPDSTPLNCKGKGNPSRNDWKAGPNFKSPVRVTPMEIKTIWLGGKMRVSVEVPPIPGLLPDGVAKETRLVRFGAFNTYCLKGYGPRGRLMAGEPTRNPATGEPLDEDADEQSDAGDVGATVQGGATAHIQEGAPILLAPTAAPPFINLLPPQGDVSVVDLIASSPESDDRQAPTDARTDEATPPPPPASLRMRIRLPDIISPLGARRVVRRAPAANESAVGSEARGRASVANGSDASAVDSEARVPTPLSAACEVALQRAAGGAPIESLLRRFRHIAQPILTEDLREARATPAGRRSASPRTSSPGVDRRSIWTSALLLSPIPARSRSKRAATDRIESTPKKRKVVESSSQLPQQAPTPQQASPQPDATVELPPSLFDTPRPDVQTLTDEEASSSFEDVVEGVVAASDISDDLITVPDKGARTDLLEDGARAETKSDWWWEWGVDGQLSDSSSDSALSSESTSEEEGSDESFSGSETTPPRASFTSMFGPTDAMSPLGSSSSLGTNAPSSSASKDGAEINENDAEANKDDAEASKDGETHPRAPSPLGSSSSVGTNAPSSSSASKYGAEASENGVEASENGVEASESGETRPRAPSLGPRDVLSPPRPSPTPEKVPSENEEGDEGEQHEEEEQRGHEEEWEQLEGVLPAVGSLHSQLEALGWMYWHRLKGQGDERRARRMERALEHISLCGGDDSDDYAFAPASPIE